MFVFDLNFFEVWVQLIVIPREGFGKSTVPNWQFMVLVLATNQYLN